VRVESRHPRVSGRAVPRTLVSVRDHRRRVRCAIRALPLSASRPPYTQARKYVIASLDLAFFTVVALRMVELGAYSPLVVSLVNVCTFAMAIALSGLRYSTRVVMFSGIVSILVHTVVFAMPLAPELRMPSIMIGLLTQGCVTVCAAYSVASLIRISREAAMKEQLARFLPPELVEQMGERARPFTSWPPLSG